MNKVSSAKKREERVANFLALIFSKPYRFKEGERRFRTAIFLVEFLQKKRPQSEYDYSIPLEKRLNEVLKTIPCYQREVLCLLYGVGGMDYVYTYAEVAAILKKTEERTRKNAADGLNGLRHPLRTLHLSGFLGNFRRPAKT